MSDSNEINREAWETPNGGVLTHRFSHSGVSLAHSQNEREPEKGDVPTEILGTSLSGTDNVDSQRQELQFRARHIQMMALGTFRVAVAVCSTFQSTFQPRYFVVRGRLIVGSAMASSLFITSGKVLYTSGPVSILLAYMLMGSVSWAMLVIPSSVGVHMVVEFRFLWER